MDISVYILRVYLVIYIARTYGYIGIYITRIHGYRRHANISTRIVPIHITCIAILSMALFVPFHAHFRIKNNFSMKILLCMIYHILWHAYIYKLPIHEY